MNLELIGEHVDTTKYRSSSTVRYKDFRCNALSLLILDIIDFTIILLFYRYVYIHDAVMLHISTLYSFNYR